jgi:hypothetical protein
VLHYEQEIDRRAFYEANAPRRELLAAAAAARMLAATGLGELSESLGHRFYFSLTADGYELARDETQLARELPLSATEDEDADTPVAADVMADSSGTSTSSPRGAAGPGFGDREHPLAAARVLNS